MKHFSTLGDPAVARLLADGAVGVIPTDTLYGIVAVAADQAAVERLFAVRHRDAQKSCIILIGDRAQLTDRQGWRPQHRQLMDAYWPGPVSIVLPAGDATPRHLRRQDGTAAYRLPANQVLRDLLLQTGPLVAPSANPQGLPPAATVQEAADYFGSRVDFYVDGGDLSGNAPSALVRVAADGRVEVLRGQLPMANSPI